jgi:hypothetical protein
MPHELATPASVLKEAKRLGVYFPTKKTSRFVEDSPPPPCRLSFVHPSTTKNTLFAGLEVKAKSSYGSSTGISSIGSHHDTNERLFLLVCRNPSKSRTTSAGDSLHKLVFLVGYCYPRRPCCWYIQL